MTEQIDDPRRYALDAYPDAGYLSRPAGPLSAGITVLLREALFLNEEAYRKLRSHVAPMKRGALVLAVIAGVIVLAQAIGLAFDFLTTLRLDLLQAEIYSAITQLALYTNQAAGSPGFAQQFSLAYSVAWQLLRSLGGYPTWSGALVSVLGTVLGIYLTWLIYGLLAHGTARWLGGQASLKQGLGTLALSYAPLLLTVILLFPGAAVAVPLIFLALLIAKYQAIKVSYGLSSGYSAAATLLPYLFAALLLLALVMFVLAYGIGRIPFLDQIIQVMSIIGPF